MNPVIKIISLKYLRTIMRCRYCIVFLLFTSSTYSDPTVVTRAVFIFSVM